MTKKTLILFLVFITAHGLSFPQTGIFPARPTSWVNDYARILSPSEAENLDNRLGAYEDSTSTQIFVVTLNETGGAEISMTAAEIGESWGVGRKGKDNGLIILIFPDERKTFIAPGYGLEEYLPDAAINRIVDKEMIPHFKNGDYYTGLYNATGVIMDLLSGKFSAEQYGKKKVQGEIPLAGIIFVMIILFLLFRSGSNRHSSIGKSIPFWLAMSMLGGSRSSHRGSFGGFSSGGRGFGGFSGGGGGSFGGGGAGGSW
jgi:uncharacterized protein